VVWSSPGFWPCGDDDTVIPSMPPAGPTLSTVPEVPAGPGTFEYNGGPRTPIPVPDGEQTVTQPPRRPVLVTDLAVSTKISGKWHYPAYGERATRTPRYGFQPAVIAGPTR
jgi:hypothetical protein